MSDKPNRLQDVFLNAIRKSKTPVTMFLVKGVKLQGVVTWFDNFSVLLRREGQPQLVYKHAISTIMPTGQVDLARFGDANAGTARPTVLQDIFLDAVRESDDPATMFLVNGVMLQGNVIAFDLFCILLLREDVVQLVYKHAISTVQPGGPIDLMTDTDGDDDAANGTD